MIIVDYVLLTMAVVNLVTGAMLLYMSKLLGAARKYILELKDLHVDSNNKLMAALETIKQGDITFHDLMVDRDHAFSSIELQTSEILDLQKKLDAATARATEDEYLIRKATEVIGDPKLLAEFNHWRASREQQAAMLASLFPSQAVQEESLEMAEKLLLMRGSPSPNAPASGITKGNLLPDNTKE